MIPALALAILPACQFTIRTAADWVHVNDADKTVICVAAAPTYTVESVGVIKLTASGTSTSPRWLRWDNADETRHPARMLRSQTAAVAQFNVTGSYWILDRLVVRDGLYPPQVMGRHNTLQKMLFEQPRPWPGRASGLMLDFVSGSDNAVVDSVFRLPFRAPGIDSYAVYISQARRITVSGNEFADLVDGVSNGPLAGGGNLIIDNEFYHTSASYTDCHGTFTPDGACSCSEGMAVVPKGPAQQPQSYIQRNLVWGFRRTDPYCAGSGTPGVGFDLGSSEMVTRNFTIQDNVIIAAEPHGIYLGRYVEDISILNNRIYGANTGIANVYGQRITITGNQFGAVAIPYATGPVAAGTVYQNNLVTGDHSYCVNTRHLTNPAVRCIQF